jgi:hypothetical protein
MQSEEAWHGEDQKCEGDMREEEWIPETIALDRPNVARIYDRLLGGYHNFEVDRAVADQMVAIYPDMRLAAQANRAFLRRAVTYVVEQGINQIVDLGSGIPTVGNVHEVAQAANADVRVVYVDVDPVAVAHSKAMLEDNPLAVAIRADVREPEAILDSEQVKELIDFDQPLAVLFVAVLHYVLDDDVGLDVVRAFSEVMVPGSYTAIAHTYDGFSPPQLQELGRLFGTAAASRRRSRKRIARLFEGFELVEPGLVYTPLWRPEGQDDVLLDQPHRALTLAGVARKP